MSALNIARVRELLQAFDFRRVFVEELNWSQPATRREAQGNYDGKAYTYRHVAELGGVVVLEIETADGMVPPAKERAAIHRYLTTLHRENLLIFVDGKRTQSVWFWGKREEGKLLPREHAFFKGQPGDLFISKISGMVFDISQFDLYGNVSLLAVTKALRDALDVERVTRRFYEDYKAEREQFTELIEGIPDERKRRWYASVLLNRLMFIYFLQRKFLLDGGNETYLQDKQAQVRDQFGDDAYYREFLRPLFFEGFAKPKTQRSAKAHALLGDIVYLNGGLFLKHKIEQEFGDAIHVPDKAFDNLLRLFNKYSWNLNDTPGGKDDEISPAVLGYIFEKYINQKAFGAYYTRPEITEYLCEQTIHALILEKMNLAPIPGLPAPKHYLTLADLLLDLDADKCARLLYEVLPNLSLLDPACGSGAFLVAAMKTLVNVYSAVTGRIEYLTHQGLQHWLNEAHKQHKSLNYYIKRKIITENLYGTDIMEEGCDIARLRLFLALVSSVQTVDELEPLPNIDFNIMAGNALIGLVHVEETKFDGRLQFGKSYRELVAERNRLVATFRELGQQSEQRDNVQVLRDDIQKRMDEIETALDELLLEEFRNLGVKYEQATWDEAKGQEGKPIRQPIHLANIQALEPFHWGYAFDPIVNGRGGFDAIVTNPPWEIFKPQDKEFFMEYSKEVTKNKMTIKEFEEKKSEILRTNAAVCDEYVAYLSRFPYVSAYYRSASQYANQISIVNGKKAGSDINLYKLFTEQCFNLLRKGGQCGIVLPSGIYTDLGAKQLRELLFGKTEITGLFGFENRRLIFEGVDSRFKFVVLTYRKDGTTDTFPAAFMRHDVSELSLFPERGALPISVELMQRLSPDSLSVMEFKTPLDVTIAEKMLKFPTLGRWLNGSPLPFSREFMSTDDHHLFNYVGDGLIVYEGKMIEQFNHKLDKPQWHISMDKLKTTRFYSRGDWKHYRFAIRRIARSNDNRTLITTVLPKNAVVVHSLFANVEQIVPPRTTLYLVALFNSYILDYAIRQQVSANVSQFFIHQLSVPNFSEADARLAPIVERAARLICTTPEFDDLAREVGLRDSRDGTTDVFERGQLRAELDGLVAHLYGLTEAEFAHILSTFPLVPEPVRVAARNAYRDVERGLVR